MMRQKAIRAFAIITESSRPVTTSASATRMGLLRPPMAISSAHYAKPSRHAAPATLPTSLLIRR